MIEDLEGKSIEEQRKEVDEATDDKENKRWYVVNTYVGHENRVKENLEKRVKTMGIEDSLFRVVVAEELEDEIKNGKKVQKMHNLFPGYVFVQMKMTDEAWYVVRNTPGVTGFIGSSGGGAKPFVVDDKQMDSILRRIADTGTKVDVNFHVGDTVKVLNGFFKDMKGTITSMNDKTQRAEATIMYFNRPTAAELDYKDLQKADDDE